MATTPPLGKIVSKSSRSSRMRNVNAKTSNLSLGSLGINNIINLNNQLSSKADRNGGWIVFHRSDCGYPNVRSYCCGGDGPRSVCGAWVDTTTRHYNPYIGSVTHADLVWYGDPYKARATRQNINDKNTSVDYNWTVDDILNMITLNNVDRYK